MAGIIDPGRLRACSDRRAAIEPRVGVPRRCAVQRCGSGLAFERLRCHRRSPSGGSTMSHGRPPLPHRCFVPMCRARAGLGAADAAGTRCQGLSLLRKRGEICGTEVLRPSGELIGAFERGVRLVLVGVEMPECRGGPRASSAASTHRSILCNSRRDHMRWPGDQHGAMSCPVWRPMGTRTRRLLARDPRQEEAEDECGDTQQTGADEEEAVAFE